MKSAIKKIFISQFNFEESTKMVNLKKFTAYLYSMRIDQHCMESKGRVTLTLCIYMKHQNNSQIDFQLIELTLRLTIPLITQTAANSSTAVPMATWLGTQFIRDFNDAPVKEDHC